MCACACACACACVRARVCVRVFARAMITRRKTYMDNFVHSGCGNSWGRSREVYSSEYAL